MPLITNYFLGVLNKLFDLRIYVTKIDKKGKRFPVPGLEPGVLDSKSKVLTITLYNRRSKPAARY